MPIILGLYALTHSLFWVFVYGLLNILGILLLIILAFFMTHMFTAQLEQYKSMIAKMRAARGWGYITTFYPLIGSWYMMHEHNVITAGLALMVFTMQTALSVFTYFQAKKYDELG